MTRRRGKDSGKRVEPAREPKPKRVTQAEHGPDEPATTGAAAQPNKRRPIDEPIE